MGGTVSKMLHSAEVVPGCTYTMTGDDEDGIMRQATEHVAAEHGMPDLSDDLTAKIRDRIKDDD